MKSTSKARRITLHIEAYTDPAGKYDASAPLNGNEDNFFVSDHGDSDGLVIMPPYGVLIAVADGMGGLNAGEVASGLAIDTVAEYFTPEKIAAMASHNGPTRQMYLERIIRQADARIKAAQRQNPAQANMGSTIVLAWLMDNELVVSWCGDSRAYIYNAANGLRLISHDHSYVQELVDRGAITYDQAFDHPQNNIVTRSLGDPQHDAKPDSLRMTMSKGDILMVCSDGLTGVLRDKKAYDAKHNLLPEMNMEDIFRAAPTLKECREMLWDAASRSGWYDNVTAVLCEMADGPQAQVITPLQRPVAEANVEETPTPSPDFARMSAAVPNTKRPKSLLWIILLLACVAVLGLIAWFILHDKSTQQPVGLPIPEEQEEIFLNQDEGKGSIMETAPASGMEDAHQEHKVSQSEAHTDYKKDVRKPDSNSEATIPSAKPKPVKKEPKTEPKESSPVNTNIPANWEKKENKHENQQASPRGKTGMVSDNTETN